ncbi:hypothetical protein ACWCPT_05800 [Streptomyces sp. NPDC002308]
MPILTFTPPSPEQQAALRARIAEAFEHFVPTSEQQAATQARIAEAFVGLRAQLRAAVPALQLAARMDEDIRNSADTTRK